ncbi:hypothetical protein [Mangrovimonas sp. DI 80]|uniref:hypothetical protein n=1 Tax=Mangrovimonas sp. DI 80 TaxID=1779330 RepID=UPI0009787F19|nr:hypothetical protein [Mangrovimonas sp. DI 80]OMP30072.1 hypothetical protein BKM32_14435 [Mangrovimonas sp. DI 80]
MSKIKICKYCKEPFHSRRSNHVYCSQSCKTKACYKRNNYKYISGHYQNDQAEIKEEEDSILADKLSSQVNEFEERMKSLLEEYSKRGMNATDIKNSAMGTLAADAITFFGKKFVAPDSLPATKGDINLLVNELNKLKNTFEVAKKFQAPPVKPKFDDLII